MKKFYLIILIFFFFFYPKFSFSKDMRVSASKLDKKMEEILEKAFEEKQKALKKAKEVEKEINISRKKLKEALFLLEKKKRELFLENEKLTKELKILKEKERNLKKTKEEKERDLKELIGFIRVNTKDLYSLLKQSPQSAFYRHREKALKPILEEVKFPGMDHIKKIVKLLFQEILLSSEVRVQKGSFVNRSGEDEKGEILVIGNFTAAYKTSKECGFLLYSDKSERFFALSKLPSRFYRKKIKSYMEGKSDDVPVDISKGAALRQLTHSLSLTDQIKKGGPLVWPILGIGVVGIILILERLFYLLSKSTGIGNLIEQMRSYALKGDWDSCLKLCEDKKDKTLVKVLIKGIENRSLKREDLENILQEAILNEIPNLERFLSTIGILAAIAPLLGLLGTVTGMINTFHVITFYGTGDPRMMSSGISEALVTTMLGLSVAIPIMLCHTLISRWVENYIAKMEESSVSLVNMIFAQKE